MCQTSSTSLQGGYAIWPGLNMTVNLSEGLPCTVGLLQKSPAIFPILLRQFGQLGQQSVESILVISLYILCFVHTLNFFSPYTLVSLLYLLNIYLICISPFSHSRPPSLSILGIILLKRNSSRTISSLIPHVWKSFNDQHKMNLRAFWEKLGNFRSFNQTF